MSLKNLDKSYSVIHIAGREYRVRYSLNALLCLECTYKPIEEILKIPAEKWDIECILQLVRAGLCDLPKNKKAVIRRDWDNIKPTIDELGRNIDIRDFIVLRNEIIDALTNSFPEPVIGDSGGNGEINFEYMRSMYCDVMHRSDADFWTSNLKEIQERTNSYMEVKGLKEPVQEMQMYED